MDGIKQWSGDAQQYIQRLEQENQEVKKENQDLKEKIKDLEKRLVYYENPHTPPSVTKISKKKTQDGKKSDELGKRGAPKGHRGATRPKPKPDEIIDVTANKCEQCGSKNIQPLKEVTKNIVEDFLPPQNPFKQESLKSLCLTRRRGKLSRRSTGVKNNKYIGVQHAAPITREAYYSLLPCLKAKRRLTFDV